MLENGVMPKKEDFCKFLETQPPLPDGFTWIDVKFKFKTKILNNKRKMLSMMKKMQMKNE